MPTRSLPSDAQRALALIRRRADEGWEDSAHLTDPSWMLLSAALRRTQIQLHRHEPLTWAEKDAAFRLMAFRPSPKQVEIARDGHQFRVVRAGRRSGKTTLAAAELVATMLKRPGSLSWVVGPYFEVTDRCWEMVTGYLERLASLGIVRIIQRSDSHGNMRIEIDNGAVCEGHSSEQGDSLQGVGLQALVMDEIAMIDEWVLMEIILPAIVQGRGWTFLIGTPLGESWASRNARRALARSERTGEPCQWREFLFESWHNTYEFPLGRNDPEILKMEREMEPDDFLQQVCAIPQRSRYAVYKEFEEDVHARPCPFDRDLPVYLSADPGSSNQYAVAVIQDLGSEVWQIDEFYKTGVLTEDVIGDLRLRAWWGNVEDCIIDDAATAEIQRWKRHDAVHFSVRAAKKPRYIEDSLPLVRRWLRDPLAYNSLTRPVRDELVQFKFGDRDWASLDIEDQREVIVTLDSRIREHPDLLASCARFFVDRARCGHTIDEFRAYKYKARKKDDRNVSENPIDFQNHLLDCFVADTLIATERGDVPIAEVRPGDRVWTRQGWKRVLDAWCQNDNAEIVEARFSDDRTVRCTPEHRFYVVAEGFRPIGGLDRYARVEAFFGRPDRIGMFSGLGFRSCEPAGCAPVYDLTVEDAHEFYANGLLVHNCVRYWLNQYKRNDGDTRARPEVYAEVA